MFGQGNSATIAPWQPEDVLVYSTGYSVILHGGYYNTNPTVNWSRVTRIVIDAYQTDQFGTDLPFPGHAEIAWTPAWVHEDTNQASGAAVISGVESYDDGPREYWDTDWIVGTGTVDGEEDRLSNDVGATAGIAVITANEVFEDV
jgi:hypothetical protein